ncbi:MAG TPA: endonuclease Q family protein [Opitutaceae bacterium]|nr:endonuclease Q family protein [Opitutaceae bacterium]
MRFAADLHLHSRYSTGVSPAMTLENIATWALSKGLNLIGTGDCLQSDWLREIEAGTEAGEPGLLKLAADVEERVWSRLPEKLRRPLRLVLSTEIDCLPSPRTKFLGLHHLVYFPSFERVRMFAEDLRKHGDLSEGRPTVNVSPLQLLEKTLEGGPGCHFAPAHVMNPWFSDLGTVGGEASLQDIYVDLTAEILAVETGLTSTPPMCRRVSSLDSLALFSCSDAHSLENLGREYTVLEIEPSYDDLFAALRAGTNDRVLHATKFPLYETRYFLNWCTECRRSYDGLRCKTCGRPLVTGSRDRLEAIADRASPVMSERSPTFQELRPLALIIALLTKGKAESPPVKRAVQALIKAVGHERYILTEASEAEIAEASTPQLARLVIKQRTAVTADFKPLDPTHGPLPEKQGALDLGF